MDAQTAAASQPPAATAPTDALLVQAGLDTDSGPMALLDRLKTAGPRPARLHAAFSPEAGQLYAYLHLEAREPLGKAAAVSLELLLQKEFPQARNVRVSRLQKVFDAAGASAGSTPVFHYAVEMDPETGWMPELSDWYDTEHMPGLAGVPGCIRASRFLNHDHGPLSLACYDLVTEETLGSAPWLAVRGTSWSDRMRPRFTNTVRTMFRSCV